MRNHTYKCCFCKFTTSDNGCKDRSYSAKHKMGQHYEMNHKELIPTDMSGYQWFYYLSTKKDHGSCVICKKDTTFNEATMKYSRFCDNPMCKQKYKEERDRRMLQKYGKVYLLDDPEMQKKMLANRSISGQYVWSNTGGRIKIPYASSYELDFLKVLDLSLHWPYADICAPSPHTYEYEYQGKKHFYIPDFFLPSQNLEVEIKSSIGDARNKESYEKELIKHNLMKSMHHLFNYVRIMDKNYTEFLTLIKEGE